MHPSTVGRYQIKQELGRGGMATVYQAYDPSFERDVAVKVLPQALLHDPQFRARFEREAKTIATLEHPAIVPVYDFGEDQGQPFIVMRLMAGGSLSDRIRNGSIPQEKVVEILNRLASALDAAHKKGIIHRDLKPGNILFDQYDNAYLSDFGIARLTEAGATLTGSAIIGTPAYMSPEQIQGDKEIDGRSDIYALGIIVFQMLTGKMPYEADTPAKQMMMHILEPVPHVSAIDPALPADCDNVIQTAMAKNPDDRYPTAQNLSQAFSNAFRPQPSTAEATQVPSSSPATVASTPVPEDATVVTPPPIPPDHVSTRAGATSASLPATGPLGEASPAALPWLAGLPLAGLVFLGIIIIGGGILYFMGRGGSGPLASLAAATPTSTATSSATPTETQALTPTPLPDTPTLDAGVAMVEASDTPSPSETPTQAPSPLPSETPTIVASPTQSAPVLGGADKVAFLHRNDIYAVNLDGSDLQQLTVDGGEKRNLHWTPDGRWIIYMLGNCAKYVELETGVEDNIACFESALTFEAFQVSPDGSQVAISLNRELFVVPFDVPSLQQARFASHLQALGTCEALNPYTRNAVKYVRWSKTADRLAFVFLGNVQGLQKDLVRIIDIQSCNFTPPTLDEFPVGRFEMRGYNDNSELQNFGWDGTVLFGMNAAVRNGGYGDLYIYNHDTHKGDLINPISGKCCYRDISWSPDGRYITFAFQDIGLGAASREEIYIIAFGTLGTGIDYAPLVLPDDFLTDARERPQPILRPAQ